MTCLGPSSVDLASEREKKQENLLVPDRSSTLQPGLFDICTCQNARPKNVSDNVASSLLCASQAQNEKKRINRHV